MDNLSGKNPFKGPVYHFTEVTSTMDEAVKNLQHGAIFMSEHQTAGRGRFPGRSWADEKGKNLLYTLILHQSHINNLPISLLAALAVMDMLQDLSILAQIKWPNDVLVEGAKISGILVELVQGYFLIGMGINVNQDQIEVQGRQVTSIRTILGYEVDKYEILENLLAKLEHRLSYPESWNRDINSRLWGKNEDHNYVLGLQNTDRVTGKIQCIHPDGALSIMTNNGVQLLYSGELSN